MHRCLSIAISLLSFAFVGISSAHSGEKKIVVSDIGFSTPESVEYYAAEDVYLVTNINGSPFAADGNGFISKIRPDGSVVDLKWIDGAKPGTNLNAPKGAAITGSHLYIADINQVQIFDLPSGKQNRSITIKGSNFLNGITPGGSDYVYVTDFGVISGFKPSGSDAIYKVWTNGKYETIVKNKFLGSPNGIHAVGTGLIFVTRSGDVIAVDQAGRQSDLANPHLGGFDGLIALNDGRLLMSSWRHSSIYVMSKERSFSVFADNLDAPADLGFDPKRNRVLVPLFKKNEVVFLPLQAKR